MDFQLTKEEIPIWGRDMTGFFLPIHPKLLSQDINLNPKLANEVFPQVAKEWHDDLTKYIDENPQLDEQTRNWYKEVFLKNRQPKVIKKYGEQALDTIVGWRDEVTTDERGFAMGLSISRNGGGTLYFNQTDYNCTSCLPLTGKKGRCFNIPRDKALELVFEKLDENLGKVQVYAHHNIDHYPGALFLRNWGLAYLNAAMDSI